MRCQGEEHSVYMHVDGVFRRSHSRITSTPQSWRALGGTVMHFSTVPKTPPTMHVDGVMARSRKRIPHITPQPPSTCCPLSPKAPPTQGNDVAKCRGKKPNPRSICPAAPTACDDHLQR